MMDLLQREHQHILAGLGVGYGKLSIFDIWAAVSVKRCKIGSKLLLTTKRNINALLIGTKIDDLE